MNGIAGLANGYGLQGWMQAFDNAASSVSGLANQGLTGASSASPTGPDLIDGMVGMSQAADGLKASIAVLRSADEMLGTVIDLVA